MPKLYTKETFSLSFSSKLNANDERVGSIFNSFFIKFSYWTVSEIAADGDVSIDGNINNHMPLRVKALFDTRKRV